MNRRALLTSLAAPLVALISLTACSSSETASVSTYIDGWSAHQAVPLPTVEGLVTDMADAYAFGAQVADGLPVAGERFGYKFGCGAAVCPFAEHVPLVGTLWSPMVRADGATVPVADFVRGFVEGELAFRLSEDVTAPITADDARRIATEVAPSAELPDFPYGDFPLSETPIIDVIADNGIARGLVLGTFMPTATVDVDSIRLEGTQDGEPVLAGGAMDVTGGSHYDALALAISLLLENGRDVKAGDVIITGTMGEPTPLTPGAFALDFGSLGAVTFTAS